MYMPAEKEYVYTYVALSCQIRNKMKTWKDFNFNDFIFICITYGNRNLKRKHEYLSKYKIMKIKYIFQYAIFIYF